ncbi:substrate-binding domain-containing protein [Blautia schinkii]|nr:substrate-binding domain-containing protein [Blautia schinkii]
MVRQIRWKIWAVICAAVLVLIAAYYYGVVREGSGRNPAVYSVILYQNTDNEWATLVQGIQQAEEDFKVKVNYIYMSDKDTVQDQAQRVQKEADAGVSGILLAAVNSEALKWELSEMHIQIPVITVESGMDGYVNISADNYKMGQELGYKILEDIDASEKEAGQPGPSDAEPEQSGFVNIESGQLKPGDEELQRPKANHYVVTVIKEYIQRDSVSERYKGLTDVLLSSDKNIRIQDRSRQEGDFSLRLFIGTIFSDCGEYIVALDKFSTEEAAAAWDSKRAAYEPYGMKFKIYGIGNTAQTVNDLDNERLRALVYQNEFNMGYEGIQALVEKEKKGYVNEQFDIRYKLVTKDTLYESENERLLFPSI